MNGKLTTREEQIVILVAAGMTNKEVAATLHTTEHMVKNRMRRIYEKSGFDNRVELALWWVKYREKEVIEVTYEI